VRANLVAHEPKSMSKHAHCGSQLPRCPPLLISSQYLISLRRMSLASLVCSDDPSGRFNILSLSMPDDRSTLGDDSERVVFTSNDTKRPYKCCIHRPKTFEQKSNLSNDRVWWLCWRLACCWVGPRLPPSRPPPLLPPFNNWLRLTMKPTSFVFFHGSWRLIAAL
jgi:hypothetical protein